MDPRPMVNASWQCPGGKRPHPASLVHVEHLHTYGDGSLDIHRCRICGRAYWCEQSEMSDWGSGGGDYYNVVRHWRLMEEDEFDAARSDPQYRPRSTLEHRQESGWRPEG